LNLNVPDGMAKTHQSALEIIEWLASDESHALDGAGLVDALAVRLCGAGVPLDRLAFHLRALHPTIFGRSIAWAPGEPVRSFDLGHGEELSERIQRSPVLHAMNTRDWQLVRTDDANWTLHDLFLGRGLAELCIAPMIHGSSANAVSAISFGTRKEEGFSPAHLALFRRILPAIRGAIELKMWRRTTKTMLDTYIGNDPERHILSGLVRRGDVRTLDAALMFCDLHGFTDLSNRLSSERVLELLNIYFDQVVPSVLQNGGEILKFMGDGVLAVFHDEGGAKASCEAAKKASHAIHHRLATLSMPDADLRAGIGLHYGEVHYGNIGSGERLDFTVIGRDVNLTSRLQTLTSQTDQPILQSARFAKLLDLPPSASIGMHRIKGFVDPVEVFACEAA
jgi:adenylate cyclase